MSNEKKSTALAVKGTFNVLVPDQASKMADTLKAYIVKQGLYTNIQGKNYAHVDGWQYAGSLMNTYPMIIAIRNLSSEAETKWQADVNIVNSKDGNIVGFGSALCSSKEKNKKFFEEYAILSMAQTRAIGKAYRNRVGWIMKLAGYEATPAEEMEGAKNVKAEEKVVKAEIVEEKKEEPQIICEECQQVELSKATATYSKRMFGKHLCRDCQKKHQSISNRK